MSPLLRALLVLASLAHLSDARAPRTRSQQLLLRSADSSSAGVAPVALPPASACSVYRDGAVRKERVSAECVSHNKAGSCHVRYWGVDDGGAPPPPPPPPAPRPASPAPPARPPSPSVALSPTPGAPRRRAGRALPPPPSPPSRSKVKVWLLLGLGSAPRSVRDLPQWRAARPVAQGESFFSLQKELRAHPLSPSLPGDDVVGVSVVADYLKHGSK
jgi:hypothetical protein